MPPNGARKKWKNEKMKNRKNKKVKKIKKLQSYNGQSSGREGIKNTWRKLVSCKARKKQKQNAEKTLSFMTN